MFHWLKGRDRFTIRCYRLFGVGAGLALFGVIGTIRFLFVMRSGEKILPNEMLVQLVLPHVALLGGLGCILMAGILLRKQLILQERRDEAKEHQA
jgi:hypothetical protein